MIKMFQTEKGLTVPAIATEQMQEVDRIAMEETGPNLYQMMENAGRNLALSAMEMMTGKWDEARYVVLAGTGGNGGGGICAARHLANRGLNVTLSITNFDRLSEVTKFQRYVYQSAGGHETTLKELENEQPNIILDSIIGYSLKDAPRGAALEYIQWANSIEVPILSLDVPSGVNSTTGETNGEYIRASKTLTLALPKTGLIPEKTGALYLADIGIPSLVYQQLGIEYRNPFGNQFRVSLQAMKNKQSGENY